MKDFESTSRNGFWAMAIMPFYRIVETRGSQIFGPFRIARTKDNQVFGPYRRT